MGAINPAAIVVVAFCTVLGAILGAPLVGLVCGLGVVLVGSVV